jgi:hypothetical protein
MTAPFWLFLAMGLSLLLVLALYVGSRVVARIQFRRQLQSYYATLDRQARDQEVREPLPADDDLEGPKP